MSKLRKIEEYNSEPVTYCARCYSLGIVHEDSIGMDCCKECGSSDLLTSSEEEWERLYKQRYGHKFVEEERDIRRSPIFQMSNDKLKTKVFNDPSWKEICRVLYPAFPEWLGKADSIVLLFAKLYQENRLDDLRMELINRLNK